ncbi:MAG: site-specific integrase, partial [Gemmatimonadales bacterium]
VHDDDDESRAQALTQEQAARFLAAARADRYAALWHVLLLGGLRPGEAFGLTWANVTAGIVRVRHSLTRIRGVAGWQLTPPKTRRGRRDVPLPDVAVRELRRWKAHQAQERLALGADYQDHGFVFTVPCGPPLIASNLYDVSFRRVMAAANGPEGVDGDLGTWGPAPTKPRSGPTPRRVFYPKFRVYDLRHTCATMLLAGGIPVQVVSERLGHKDVTTTMNVYQHVQPTMQEAAVDKLEAMFGTA